MIKNLFSKINISLFCFLFINFIYGIKYYSRFSEYYLLITSLLTVFFMLIWKSKLYLTKLSKYLNIINLVIVIGFIFIFILIFQKVPVESLNVDRWSVITSFWDNYFDCKYVYFAKSCDGNYPGPMPFYFILALPFYAIGELGYFSLFGLIGFLVLLKTKKIKYEWQTVLIILVTTSTFFLHEIVCRSNIFLNSVLVLFVLNFYFSRKNLDLKKLFFSGTLIGLSLSTRNVLIIPFIVAFVFELKNKNISFKQICILATITIIAFVITFLPFVWNHVDDFKIMNPFLIQSSGLVPVEYSILFIFMAFGFGYFAKNINEVYFYSGINLFISIVIYFITQFNQVGFHEAFFGSNADITYFILCIPFFLFYFGLESKTK